MKDTVLYKSLAKAVRAEDHENLLAALKAVKQNNGYWQEFKTNTPSLLHAFKWQTTPQGHKYWKTLYDSMKAAGWKKQVSLC